MIIIIIIKTRSLILLYNDTFFILAFCLIVLSASYAAITVRFFYFCIEFYSYGKFDSIQKINRLAMTMMLTVATTMVMIMLMTKVIEGLLYFGRFWCLFLL